MVLAGIRVKVYVPQLHLVQLALDVSADSIAAIPSIIPVEHRPRLHPFQADITSPEAVAVAISAWVDGGGGGESRRLDVLVNNAGISDKMDPTGDCDLDMWNKQFLVNITGPFITSQLAIRQFLKQEPVEGQRGVILNVISAAALHGARAGVAYKVAKHGTVGLTRSTAAFYGPKGIRCLAILQGPMLTNIVKDESYHKQFHPEGVAMSESIC